MNMKISQAITNIKNAKPTNGQQCSTANQATYVALLSIHNYCAQLAQISICAHDAVALLNVIATIYSVEGSLSAKIKLVPS